MAGLGELVLYFALSVGALSTVLSVAGGWTGRGDLAVVGGRAARATAALLVVSVAGLAHALLSVQLKYAYVAAFTGFQDDLPARLAALWSGPAGALLLFTALLWLAAAANNGPQVTRRGVARSGALAGLGLVALLIVLTRARPFAQPEAVAVQGAGLSNALKDLGWQVEWLAVVFAALFAASTFAAIVGEQISESPESGPQGGAAARWTVAFLTLALLASAWRAYGDSGRLLDGAGVSRVMAHVPAWLVALAYLHAPGGRAVPGWAARWRRVMGVTLFPAVVGAAAALLAAAGDVPPPRIWSAGLAVGIISGSLAGYGQRRRGVEALRDVPGYGLWAFAGGWGSLIGAGAAVVWGLGKAALWIRLGPALIVVMVASAAAWSVVRPAGGWRHVGLVAAALAGTAAAAAFLFTADALISLTLAVVAATAVGFAADLVRLRAARHARDDGAPRVSAPRSRRRLASAIAHLGIALLTLGFAATGLVEVASREMEPGETITVRTVGAPLEVVYLGLSRYQVGPLDKRVASFSVARAGRPPELASSSLIWDPVARQQSRVPYIARGLLHDTSVTLTGLRAGGVLILGSVVVVRRTEP